MTSNNEIVANVVTSIAATPKSSPDNKRVNANAAADRRDDVLAADHAMGGDGLHFRRGDGFGDLIATGIEEPGEAAAGSVAQVFRLDDGGGQRRVAEVLQLGVNGMFFGERREMRRAGRHAEARAFDEAGAQKLLEDDDAEAGEGGGERMTMKNRDAGERDREQQKIDQHGDVVSAELRSGADGHVQSPAGLVSIQEAGIVR